ncbi:MAG: hypothetical protein AB7T49_05035 [Oligoflexales bacterium]
MLRIFSLIGAVALLVGCRFRTESNNPKVSAAEYVAEARSWVRREAIVDELESAGYFDPPQWNLYDANKKRAVLEKVKTDVDKKFRERVAYLENYTNMSSDQILDILKTAQIVDKNGLPVGIDADDNYYRLKDPASGKILFRAKFKRSARGPDATDNWRHSRGDYKDFAGDMRTSIGAKGEAIYQFVSNAGFPDLIAPTVTRVETWKDAQGHVLQKQEFSVWLRYEEGARIAGWFFKEVAEDDYGILRQIEGFHDLNRKFVRPGSLSEQLKRLRQDFIKPINWQMHQALIYFVAGNTDSTLPANTRILPFGRLTSVDHDLAFQPFPVARTFIHKDEVLEETLTALTNINMKALSRAGQKAGLDKESAIWAMVRLQAVQDNPDLLSNLNIDVENLVVKRYYSDAVLRKKVATALGTAYDDIYKPGDVFGGFSWQGGTLTLYKPGFYLGKQYLDYTKRCGTLDMLPTKSVRFQSNNTAGCPNSFLSKVSFVEDLRDAHSTNLTLVLEDGNIVFFTPDNP